MSTGNVGGALSQETLAKRAQAAAQDPAFQRLKTQFASDFDFSSPGAKRLHNLMSKLKRWIKILELKTKSLQKYVYLYFKIIHVWKDFFYPRMSVQSLIIYSLSLSLFPSPFPDHFFLKIVVGSSATSPRPLLMWGYLENTSYLRYISEVTLIDRLCLAWILGPTLYPLFQYYLPNSLRS